MTRPPQQRLGKDALTELGVQTDRWDLHPSQRHIGTGLRIDPATSSGDTGMS